MAKLQTAVDISNLQIRLGKFDTFVEVFVLELMEMSDAELLEEQSAEWVAARGLACLDRARQAVASLH